MNAKEVFISAARLAVRMGGIPGTDG